MLAAVRKTFACLLICSGLVGLNAASCAIGLEQECPGGGLECGIDSAELPSQIASPLKTVAIS